MAEEEDIMEDALTCGICSEEYQAGTREPVTLHCGHTFCRHCLLTLEKPGGLPCPACRKLHAAATVSCLPPSYTILAVLDTYSTTTQVKECVNHKEPLGYWCRECERLACGLCIFESHKDDNHTIISSRVILQEKKQWLQEETSKLSKMLEAQLVISVRKSVSDLLSLLQKNFKVTKIQEEAISNSALLKKTTSMEMMLQCETKHRRLTDACQNTDLGHGSLESVEASFPVNLPAQIPGTQATNTSKPYPVTCSVQYGDGRWARLAWDDDDLLLFSFSTQNLETHFTLHWSAFSVLGSVMLRPVFLDLMAGVKFLGRVTIKLWSHLRRAQHFMGLCLGIWGATFKDTTFSRVHETQFCKFLIGGTYRPRGGGSPSTAGLMENLEWDGQYAGEDIEGQIVAFGGGHTHLDSVFGICVTAKSKGGRSRCPFGNVVSGMEVLKQAATYVPSSQISIVQCGVIFSHDELKDILI